MQEMGFMSGIIIFVGNNNRCLISNLVERHCIGTSVVACKQQHVVHQNIYKACCCNMPFFIT